MTYSGNAAVHGSVPAMVIISAKSCKIPFKISSRHEDFCQTALMPVSAVFFCPKKNGNQTNPIPVSVAGTFLSWCAVHFEVM